MKYYTSLKKNFVAVNQKAITNEIKKEIFSSIPHAVAWEDGFFFYIRDHKESFLPDLEIHKFLSEGNAEPICSGCKNRLRFISSNKKCDGCFFHSSKNYASSRFSEKMLFKKLEELGFAFMEASSLYDEVLPIGTPVSKPIFIDKKKLDPVCFSNQHYLTIPYWRFGSTGRFIENVEVKFDFQPFKDDTDFGRVNLNTRDVSSNAILKGLSSSNSRKNILLDVQKRVSRFLYEPTISLEKLPVSFYSRMNHGQLFQSTIEKTPPLSLAIKHQDGREYYHKEGKLYSICGTETKFIRDFDSKYFAFYGTVAPEYLSDGKFVYEYYSDVSNVRFSIRSWSKEIQVSYTDMYNRDVLYKTLNDLLKNHPDADLDTIPFVYLKELVGEKEETSFEKGDAVYVISPTDKNKALLNILGEVLESKENTIIVGFLNNHFKETFESKEIIKVS